jgi:putative nucleotidyltransferase with HDIG domain
MIMIMAQTRLQADSNAASAFELARMIETKDPYTAGHTCRVANYGQILAVALGYSPRQVETMITAGTLHDIGKINVPDHILTKPGRLTVEEFEIIKRHPQDGFEMLQPFQELRGVLNVVQMHHEAYDGSGYPFGRAGSEIPPEARLFAVVDAFDAMTSSRCYRTAMDGEVAIEEIQRNRGQQFDPVIANIFIKLYRDELLEHILGHSDFGVKVGNCPKCGPVLELQNGRRLDSEIFCKACKSRFVIETIENGECRLKYVGSIEQDASRRRPRLS